MGKMAGAWLWGGGVAESGGGTDWVMDRRGRDMKREVGEKTVLSFFGLRAGLARRETGKGEGSCPSGGEMQKNGWVRAT